MKHFKKSCVEILFSFFFPFFLSLFYFSMIFGVYHVIWIICLLAMFLAIVLCLRKTGRNRAGTITEQPSPHYMVVDMNGITHQSIHPPTYPPPPTQYPTSDPIVTYRPPEDSIEPPPPSYHDHRKDRVPNV
ncbi:hypothetical protein BD560DRAFT_406652 [Blakeslea trispora]|nr:hypothetical protein BD560DRAFT_406652 [Blakeslea trispora]